VHEPRFVLHAITQVIGETPSAYRARDHGELQVVPGCRVMLLTRPRKPARQSSSFEEASLPALA
jgi:hypothetical protein